MTQPGSIIAPQPGWWVRTDQIGTTAGEYGWTSTTSGLRTAVGSVNSTYGWHSSVLSSPPILLDAVGGGGYSSGSANLSWSHTVGATGTALLVWVSVPQAQTVTVTAGGTSMTLLENFNYPVTAGYTSLTLAVFGLLNPPTGAQTISVHVGTADYYSANSVSYTNVNSFGGAITASGSTASASLTAHTDASHVVAQAFGSDGYGVSTAFASYNQTSRWNQPGVNSGTAALLEIGDAAGAATVNFTATAPTANGWGGVGIILPGLLVSPTGAPSGEAFGTATFTPGSVNISPTGIASAEAVGTPDLVYPQSITTTGITSTEAFGTTTFAVQAPQNISPTGITSTEAFGSDTLTPGTVDISPTGIATGEAFGSATVSAPSLPPAFDAVGAGKGVGTASTLSWSHTATAGAYVIVAVDAYAVSSVTSVTYNLVAMTPLGSPIYLNNSSANGLVQLFGMASVPGGAQTVKVTLPSSTYAAANSVSYLHVNNVSAVQTAFGSGTSLSQAVTTTGLAVHAFGDDGAGFNTVGSFTGGTSRTTVTASGATNAVNISDSSGSATFHGTAGGAVNWAGATVILT